MEGCRKLSRFGTLQKFLDGLPLDVRPSGNREALQPTKLAPAMSGRAGKTGVS